MVDAHDHAQGWFISIIPRASAYAMWFARYWLLSRRALPRNSGGTRFLSHVRAASSSPEKMMEENARAACFPDVTA